MPSGLGFCWLFLEWMNFDGIWEMLQHSEILFISCLLQEPLIYKSVISNSLQEYDYQQHLMETLQPAVTGYSIMTTCPYGDPEVGIITCVRGRDNRIGPIPVSVCVFGGHALCTISMVKSYVCTINLVLCTTNLRCAPWCTRGADFF